MDLADADADAANRLQLRDLARRVRAAPSQPRTSSRSDVDAAFAEFERVCKAAARLCRELLGDRERGGGCGEEAGAAGVQKSGRGRVHGRTASAVSAVSAMTLSISRRGLGANGDAARGGAAAGASEGPEVLGPEVTPSAARDARPKTVAVVDGLPDRRGNGDAMTAAVLPMPVDFESLEAVREWRACLEELVAAYNGQVAETDKADEVSARPAGRGTSRGTLPLTRTDSVPSGKQHRPETTQRSSASSSMLNISCDQRNQPSLRIERCRSA